MKGTNSMSYLPHFTFDDTLPAGRRKRKQWASALLAASCMMTIALGGSGVVNNNGTIDVTLNLRFAPNATDLQNVRDQVTSASQTLWHASRGQFRFGNVTITSGSVNEDLADA